MKDKQLTLATDKQLTLATDKQLEETFGTIEYSKLSKQVYPIDEHGCNGEDISKLIALLSKIPNRIKVEIRYEECMYVVLRLYDINDQKVYLTVIREWLNK